MVDTRGTYVYLTAEEVDRLHALLEPELDGNAEALDAKLIAAQEMLEARGERT